MELAQAFVRLRVDKSLVAADTSAGIKEGAAAADVEAAGASTGKRFGSALSSAAATAIKVGLAGAAGIGAAAVYAATDFQAAMKRIQTQAGASASDVAVLSKQVLQLGTTTQQGPQQLANALYHLKSVGLDNAQAMTALATSSKLAAVGGSDLEQTANALAGAWRSGIKGAQNFGQAAATINAIIGAGNMTMTQFVGALGTGVLVAATTFGISLKQVGGAMALLTDEGMPAELAATRLRMSISLLGAPSAIAAKQLSTIGLSSTALATAMRSPGGLVAAIGLLKSHLDASGLSAVQSAALLSRAFGGGQSSSAILAMINQFDTLKKKQDQINGSVSKFGAAVAAQQQTAAAQFGLLKSNIEVLGIKLGNDLLGPVTDFVHYLAVDALPAVQTFGTGLLKYIPVNQISQAWNDIKGLFGFGSKTPKPPKLPPVGPHQGLSVIAPDVPAAAMPLPRAFQGAHQGLAAIQPSGSVAKAAASSFATQIGTEIGNSGNVIGKALSTALSKINWKQVFTSAAGAAGQIGSGMIALIAAINWTALGKQAAYSLVPFAVSLVNNLVNAILSEAIHHPLDMIGFLLALFPIGKGLSILGDVVEHLPFGSFVGGLLKWFGGGFEKAGGGVFKLIGRLGKNVGGWIIDLIPKDVGGMTDVLAPKGRELIDGFFAAIKRDWQAGPTKWLMRIGRDAIEDVGSLAKTLWNAGADLISGLWRGAENRWPTATGWLKGLGRAIIGFFGGAPGWLVGAGRAVLDGFLSGLKAAWGGVTSFVSSIGGWIARHKGPIEYDRTLLVPHGEAIMDSLLTGLTNRQPQLGRFLAGLTKQISLTDLMGGGVSGVALASAAGGTASPAVPGVAQLPGQSSETSLLAAILGELRGQPAQTAAGVANALGGVTRSAVVAGRVG